MTLKWFAIWIRAKKSEIILLWPILLTQRTDSLLHLSGRIFEELPQFAAKSNTSLHWVSPGQVIQPLWRKFIDDLQSSAHLTILFRTVLGKISLVVRIEEKGSRRVREHGEERLC
jgi:hypothetical protein